MSALLTNWIITLPVATVLGGAVIGVLIEAFVPFGPRRSTQVGWSLMVMLAAFGLLVWRFSEMQGIVLFGGHGPENPLGLGEYMETPITLLLQLMLVIVGILSLLVMSDMTSANDGAFASQPADEPGSANEALSDRLGRNRSEIFPLTLFSLGGMMIFPASTSLLTMFVALEVFSLPLYILAATARRRRLLSQEAAIKYFILGAFSSGFFLMGAAFFFGSTGSLNLFHSGAALGALLQRPTPDVLLLVVGLGMVLVGLLFKVGAVPFHSWTPDVYTGAPTPVTGYMAAAVKIAAFGALGNVLYSTSFVQGEGIRWDALSSVLPAFGWILWAVIIATMLVGTVVGMVQENVKRMIAYSSIAHAGFILIAYMSNNYIASQRAILFYLLGYAIATVGAFAVVTMIRETDDGGNILGEANNLSQWAGLGKTNPWLAGAMLVFLMSFAGIPLTAGFVGKFLVFSEGVSGGASVLVALAILASAATAFFYFRLTVLMFFHDPVEGTQAVRAKGEINVVLVLCVVATILLGVLPNLVLRLL